MKTLKIVSVLIITLFVSACASVAPTYQPNFDTVNTLKDQNLPNILVGEFTEGDASVNKISVRAASLVSPYDNSYAKYLKNALEEELKQASLWNTSSTIIVSGVLLKNELNAAGIKEATSMLSARFIVTNNNEELYNKIHTIQHQWGSSFVGAIAFSNAEQNLSVSFQNLIRAFLLDPELLNSL